MSTVKTQTSALPSQDVPRPPGQTFPRLSVEVTTDEHEVLQRTARAAANLSGKPLREWLFDAIREKLQRDAPNLLKEGKK